MEQIERICTIVYRASIILVIWWPEGGESYSIDFLFYHHVITRYIIRKALVPFPTSFCWIRNPMFATVKLQAIICFFSYVVDSEL